MIIKPIRTEADYQRALAEIDRLWNAPAGSPEADQLDVLFTLVAAYEAEQHAIALPDPLAMLEHVMESRGLTHEQAIQATFEQTLQALNAAYANVPAEQAESEIAEAVTFAREQRQRQSD